MARGIGGKRKTVIQVRQPPAARSLGVKIEASSHAVFPTDVLAAFPKQKKGFAKPAKPGDPAPELEPIATALCTLLAHGPERAAVIESFGIVSYEVPGFISYGELLERHDPRANPAYLLAHGLAEMLAFSLIAKEKDLNPNNWGLNGNGWVVRIDLGRCLGEGPLHGGDTALQYPVTKPVMTDDIPPKIRIPGFFGPLVKFNVSKLSPEILDHIADPYPYGLITENSLLRAGCWRPAPGNLGSELQAQLKKFNLPDTYIPTSEDLTQTPLGQATLTAEKTRDFQLAKWALFLTAGALSRRDIEENFVAPHCLTKERAAELSQIIFKRFQDIVTTLQNTPGYVEFIKQEDNRQALYQAVRAKIGRYNAKISAKNAKIVDKNAALRKADPECTLADELHSLILPNFSKIGFGIFADLHQSTPSDPLPHRLASFAKHCFPTTGALNDKIFNLAELASLLKALQMEALPHTPVELHELATELEQTMVNIDKHEQRLAKELTSLRDQCRYKNPEEITTLLDNARNSLTTLTQQSQDFDTVLGLLKNSGTTLSILAETHPLIKTVATALKVNVVSKFSSSETFQTSIEIARRRLQTPIKTAQNTVMQLERATALEEHQQALTTPQMQQFKQYLGMLSHKVSDTLHIPKTSPVINSAPTTARPTTAYSDSAYSAPPSRTRPVASTSRRPRVPPAR